VSSANDYLETVERQLAELTERGAHRSLRARVRVPAPIARQRAPCPRSAKLRWLRGDLLAGAVNPDRQKVVAAYRPALSLKGEAARGMAVFSKNCASCHRLAGIGQPVGPDLASVGDKSPPALLLHGIGMDWRVWQAISRRMHPHYHLYFLDLRGHGESGKPPAGYTLAHYAADVEDLLELLDLRDTTLVGSSLGGMVALAVEAPTEIIARRVLVDPPIEREETSSLATFSQILTIKLALPSEDKPRALF